MWTVKHRSGSCAWAGYLRCDECGVDAGKACRDMDDLPALEVCEGRRLVIDDSANRTRRAKSEDVRLTADGRRKITRNDPVSYSPDATRKRAAGVVGEPRFAPCECCGERTRLWGKAIETGRTWCDKPACRLHLRRDKWARLKASRRTATCEVCGGPSEYRTCGVVCAGALRRTPAKQCPVCGVYFHAHNPRKTWCSERCWEKSGRRSRDVTPSTDTL